LRYHGLTWIVAQKARLLDASELTGDELTAHLGVKVYGLRVRRRAASGRHVTRAHIVHRANRRVVRSAATKDSARRYL
jgi:hypothetical protein